MAGRRYKRGMADASRAYQAFGQKQEDALRHILNEVQGGRKDISDALGELDANFDNLYDRLDASEKEKLYSVSMPFDLKTLDEYEKMFLIGALFTLAEDCRPTENQQKYILTLKKYLEIPEPPKDPVDPLNIENIDSVEAQKAIYQVVLEYLSLQDEECFDVTDLQTDFLDSFNLSPKIRRAITARVNFLYDVTGTVGLVEKYGFVNQEEIRSKEAEELNQIREAERRKKLDEEVLRKVIEKIKRGLFGYEICFDSNKYILLGKSRIRTDEEAKNAYVLINKNTGEEKYVGDVFKNARPGNILEDSNRVIYHDEKGRVSVVTLDSLDSIHTSFLVNELLDFGNDKIVARNQESELCLYYIEKDVVIKVDDYVNFHSMAFLTDAGVIYFNGSTVKFYSCEEKRSKTIYKFNGSIIQAEIFDNKLFVMLDCKRPEFDICEYAIVSLSYLQSVVEPLDISKGLTYPVVNTIKSINNGWCFIEEPDISVYRSSPRFELKYFNMETNSIEKLSSNFGTYEWMKLNAFDKKHIHHSPYTFDVVGSKIVYYRRTSITSGKYCFFDINEPAAVHEVEW